MMNRRDDSWLSAYLDGELDDEQRAAIEARLACDPRLTREVSELARTRDLIAGLTRPRLAADFAQAIVARLDSRKRPISLLFSLGNLDGPRSLALGSSLLAAAALLIAATLSPRAPADRTRPSSISVVRSGKKSEPIAGVKNAPGSMSETLPRDPETPWAELEPAEAKVSALSKNPVRHVDERDRNALIVLLDHPRVDRWLIEVDPEDYGRVKRVVDELATGFRLEHPARGRIESGDGLPTSAGRAGRSVIHALEVTDSERARLLATLLPKLPKNSLRRDRPDAPLLTGLIERDGIRFEEGPTVGIVRAPDDGPHLHSKKETPLDRPIFPNDGWGDDPKRAGDDQPRTRETDPLPGEPDEVDSNEPQDSLLLVWLAERGGHPHPSASDRPASSHSRP